MREVADRRSEQEPLLPFSSWRAPANADLWRLDVMYNISNRFSHTVHVLILYAGAASLSSFRKEGLNCGHKPTHTRGSGGMPPQGKF